MASRPLWVKKLLGLENPISVVPLSLLSGILTVSKAFLKDIREDYLIDEVVVVSRVAKGKLFSPMDEVYAYISRMFFLVTL